MIVIFSLIQTLLLILSIIVSDAAVPIRLTITFSFLFFVLIKFFCQKQADHYKYLVLGVFACFTGDLIFGNVIPISASFLGGIVAFGIAQIFFICVFIKILKANKIKVFNRRLFISMSVLSLICLLICFILVQYSATSTIISFGILAYSLLLCTMASFAISLTSINIRCWIIAAGAILFVVSDMIIGLTGFAIIRIANPGFAIWSTYVAALMGIIYGVSSYSVTLAEEKGKTLNNNKSRNSYL
ncbi:MAG: lysoplasmalogenase family protein [Ruminiclostridium sp.]